MNRENIWLLLRIIKKTDRDRNKIPEYARMIIFAEDKSTLIPHSTPFLTYWVRQFTKLVDKRLA